ncbi:MAG TPA: YceI family protein [Gemmatimonadaceae bacterium]|nr:YceI family protein [Gemmatimonadaceae bacterium]
MTAAMTTTTETALPTTLEWSIDPAHTQVGFSVKHLMITNVKGRFPQVSGTVRLDPATSQPEVDVSIDANSITTGDPKRDAHLRSADFLHADKHPTLQFRATRLDGNVDTKFTLDGDLTIRGVTRPVTLYVIAEGRANDPWGNSKAGYTATTHISRKDFGLEWNVALEAGGVLVGDDVKITIEAQLVKV